MCFSNVPNLLNHLNYLADFYVVLKKNKPGSCMIA